MLRRPALLAVAAILLVTVTAQVTHKIILTQVPVKVMDTIENRIASQAGGWNRCLHNQAYGPQADTVRRANPDSLVSVMAYDLSDGPIRVSGETWPRYWSISLYQHNTDNFFVRNDRGLANSRFDFILALDHHDTSDLSGERIVSPTTKGIMLIRRFAADEADMPGIRDNQNAMYCGAAVVVDKSI